MATQDSVSFEDFAHELIEEGYEERQPRPSSLARKFGIDGSSIDRETSEETQCDSCGNEGMEYRPFLGENIESNYFTGEPRREYRAFMVCPRCGHWLEF